MNPQILYTNYSNYSFTASNGNTNNDVSNLYNYYAEDFWQSSNTGSNQYLQINLTSATPVNTVIIHNHNMDTIIETGSIKFQCADNIGFTSNVTDLATITATDNILYNDSFNSVTKQYYRVLYSGSLNDSPMIGNIFIGTPISFSGTYDWNYKKGNYEHVTTEKVSLSGRIKTSQVMDGRLKFELNFKLLTEQFKQDFITFVKNNRGKTPFYFIDVDGITYLVVLENNYQPVDVVKWNYNDVNNLTMKAVSVGVVTQQVTMTIYISDYELITSVS